MKFGTFLDKAASVLRAVSRSTSSSTGASTSKPSTSKPSPSKPSTTKPSTAKPPMRPSNPSTPSPVRPPEQIGTGADAIHVEYSPRMDGDPDPGEVVWTWVTFEEDPSQGKDRPVVIIGHRHGLLAAVALTSKRHDREPQVAVGTGSWDREGRPSYAKVDRVLDVEPGAVRREGAILGRDHFVQIVDGVRHSLHD